MPRTSLWAAAGLLVLTSCFNPSFESGRSACGAGGECPSGLECDLSSRLCFTPGTAPDASIDVVQIDAIPRGNVTIVVQDQAGVASNRPVLFNEPDGTTAVVNTDADGRVVREIPEGTTVTSFIRPNEGDGAFLLTYAGVMPGETVRMTVFRITEPTPPSATVNFPANFVRPSDGAAADNYQIDFACTAQGSATSPITGLGIRQDCRTPQNTVNAVAYATVGGLREGFTFASGIPVPATDFTVTLGAWRTDFLVITPTVMNLPTDAAHADAGPPKPSMRVRFRAAGVYNRYSSSSTSLTFLATPYVGDPAIRAANGVFNNMIVGASFGHGGTLPNEASFSRSFSPTVLAPLLDLSQAMPPINQLGATFDADKATISAGLAGPLPSEGETTAITFFTWPISGQPDGGGWLIMAPAADVLDGTFVTPTLPTGLVEIFNPAGVGTRSVGMALARSTCRSGRDMRANGLEDFEAIFGDPPVPDCLVDFVAHNFDI